MIEDYYIDFLKSLSAAGLGYIFSIAGFSKDALKYVERAESEGYIKTLVTSEPGKKDMAKVVSLYDDRVTDKVLEEYF